MTEPLSLAGDPPPVPYFLQNKVPAHGRASLWDSPSPHLQPQGKLGELVTSILPAPFSGKTLPLTVQALEESCGPRHRRHTAEAALSPPCRCPAPAGALGRPSHNALPGSSLCLKAPLHLQGQSITCFFMDPQPVPWICHHLGTGDWVTTGLNTKRPG